MLTKPVKILMALLLVAACTGCPDQTPNSTKLETPSKPEAVAETGPQTFAEAAESLVEMKNTIRDGFAAGDLDAAHGPLHEVGDVLEKLVDLAKKTDVPADQLKAIEQAKEKLFDAFGNIDKTFHGGEGSTYDEEAETIQAAMKVIVEAAGVKDDSETDSNSQTSADDGLPSAGDGTVDAGTVTDTDDDQ